MAEFNALPLWTDAYLGDTTHLTTIEHGAYLLLLITAWRRRATLPDDDAQLAKFCRMTPKQWARISATVRAFFHSENGELVQRRLKDEWEAVRQHSHRQSDRVKARWLKYKETADTGRKSGNTGSIPPVPVPVHGPVKKDSVPSGLPAEPAIKGPIDLQAELWKSARKLMADRGIESARAGPLIGRWLKTIGPPDAGPTLLAILAGAEANCHGDLIPYVEMAVRNRGKANGKLTPDQQRDDDRAAILRGLGIDAPARGTGSGGNGGQDTGGARKRAAIAGTIV
jgi:uncharacterized protein YdaU (DUF1376 family)